MVSAITPSTLRTRPMTTPRRAIVRAARGVNRGSATLSRHTDGRIVVVPCVTSCLVLRLRSLRAS